METNDETTIENIRKILIAFEDYAGSPEDKNCARYLNEARDKVQQALWWAKRRQKDRAAGLE